MYLFTYCLSLYLKYKLHEHKARDLFYSLFLYLEEYLMFSRLSINFYWKDI